MTKITKEGAAKLVGVGPAQFRRLARDAGLKPTPGLDESMKPCLFYSYEDVRRLRELRDRKREARAAAGAKARWKPKRVGR